MNFAVLLIGDYCAEIYVFDAPEDILLDLRIYFFHICYEVLDLKAFRVGLTVLVTGRAGVSELAGALYEVEVVIVAPVLYLSLADEIKRTYQLHTLEVGTVELWHHRLHLTSVEHTHKDSLDDVVKVVTERYLIAAESFSVTVKVAAAHTGANVAGIFFDIKN